MYQSLTSQEKLKMKQINKNNTQRLVLKRGSRYTIIINYINYKIHRINAKVSGSGSRGNKLIPHFVFQFWR